MRKAFAGTLVVFALALGLPLSLGNAVVLGYGCAVDYWTTQGDVQVKAQQWGCIVCEQYPNLSTVGELTITGKVDSVNGDTYTICDGTSSSPSSCAWNNNDCYNYQGSGLNTFQFSVFDYTYPGLALYCGNSFETCRLNLEFDVS